MPSVIQLTPPGRGAIATLRVEGPGALAAVQSLFRARGGRRLQEHAIDRPVVGHFGGGENSEEVVVRRCDDGAVEIHCHGGLAAVARIEDAMVAAGCQRIGWRDWAAANERSATAAAALTALADARTERTAAILLDQYHGAFDRALSEIREMLARGELESAHRQRELLLERAALGRHLVNPWRVVLAGRVNVGKSSLLNALAGYDRAIVHAAPGTTRDAVTVSTAIDGWPAELCDTAGLRDGAGPIEQAGIERAQDRLAAADLVILVFDRSQPWSDADDNLARQWPGAICVHNKSDLPAASGVRRDGVAVSALAGTGTDRLLDAISRRLVPDPPPPGAAVPFTARQIEQLRDSLIGAGKAD